MKITNTLKRNYLYVSITLLGLGIYVIFYPFISKLLESISPVITKCPYLAMTGSPCPLCGGTRYIAGLPNILHDITYLFHPFGVMILFVVFEICFRIFVIYQIKKERPLQKLLIIDIIIHSIAIVSFFTYEILFFLQ